MKITRLVSNILKSNVFILEKEGHCLIIDSGCDLDAVIDVVGDNKVDGLLLTHGHYDHCANCLIYAKAFNTKIYANKKIISTMTNKNAIYSEDNVTFDNFLDFVFIENDCTLNLANFEIQCFSIGGHSKCCEGYLIDGNLFAGDVLFNKSIGRTDLVGSDKKEMLCSLCKLENLSYNKVYSGHGEESDYQNQMKNIKVFKRFLMR